MVGTTIVVFYFVKFVGVYLLPGRTLSYDTSVVFSSRVVADGGQNVVEP